MQKKKNQSKKYRASLNQLRTESRIYFEPRKVNKTAENKFAFAVVLASE